MEFDPNTQYIDCQVGLHDYSQNTSSHCLLQWAQKQQMCVSEMRSDPVLPATNFSWQSSTARFSKSINEPLAPSLTSLGEAAKIWLVQNVFIPSETLDEVLGIVHDTEALK